MRRTIAFVFCITMLISMVALPLTAQAATELEKRAAIDNGLAWLATQQQADGRWVYNGGVEDTAATGSVLLAFLEEKANWAVDYSAVVALGFEFLLKQAQVYNIVNQPAGNPDSDGNGIGVKFVLGGDNNRDTYVTGIVVPTFVASGTPNALVTVGPLVGRTDGSGPGGAWTYQDVVRNAMDYFAYGQSEAATGFYRGGWRYYANNGSSDTSTSQWPSLSGLFASNMGVSTPGFVKDELAYWINVIQNADGGADYDGGWGSNEARTGALLVMMAFAGDDINNIPYNLTNADVLAALAYINTNWQTTANNTWNGNFNHPYAMWSIYKGLETAVGLADTTYITNLHNQATARGGNPAPLDPGDVWNWWEDYNEWLYNTQNANGSWAGYDSWTGPLATAWYINILAGVPVPVNPLGLTKTDNGQTVLSGQNVTYDICYDNLQNNFVVSNVILTDPLPANTSFVSATGGGALIAGVVTWNIGTLPAAAPQQCVQLTLKVNAAPGSTVVNIATIDTAETSATTATDDTPVAKIAVPTLSQWGMVLFMLLMGLVGLRSIAKVRER